jgi:hypothetical protein
MGTSTRRAPAVQHVEVALGFGGDLFDLVVAHHGGGVADHGLELVGGGVGARFLHEAQQRRDHHHGADHDGGLHVLGEKETRPAGSAAG